MATPTTEELLELLKTAPDSVPEEVNHPIISLFKYLGVEPGDIRISTHHFYNILREIGAKGLANKKTLPILASVGYEITSRHVHVNKAFVDLKRSPGYKQIKSEQKRSQLRARHVDKLSDIFEEYKIKQGIYPVKLNDIATLVTKWCVYNGKTSVGIHNIDLYLKLHKYKKCKLKDAYGQSFFWIYLNKRVKLFIEDLETRIEECRSIKTLDQEPNTQP